MSSRLTPTYTPRRNDESDESPPPYSLVPTDEVTLEFGPTRPFLPPPQQPQRQRPSQPPRERELSDFARDFYAAAGGASRTAETPPRRPPLHQPPTQNSIPDDGKPTRTPVPGHPLLNDGKTLVYPPGYECNKCHNTGYKSFDPSNPCRKCWDKYSKPFSGPIIYSSWDGPSNRQRPLLNLRSSATNPPPSPSRSFSSVVDQARNNISSFPGSPAGPSHPPPSSAVYPPRFPPVPPPPPSQPQPNYTAPPPMNRSASSTWPRNGPPSPVVYRPGDPRIGGKLCWNCDGSGRTFGFLLLSDNSCDLCGGIGRLL